MLEVEGTHEVLANLCPIRKFRPVTSFFRQAGRRHVQEAIQVDGYRAVEGAPIDEISEAAAQAWGRQRQGST